MVWLFSRNVLNVPFETGVEVVDMVSFVLDSVSIIICVYCLPPRPNLPVPTSSGHPSCKEGTGCASYFPFYMHGTSQANHLWTMFITRNSIPPSSLTSPLLSSNNRCGQDLAHVDSTQLRLAEKRLRPTFCSLQNVFLLREQPCLMQAQAKFGRPNMHLLSTTSLAEEFLLQAQRGKERSLQSHPLESFPVWIRSQAA